MTSVNAAPSLAFQNLKPAILALPSGDKAFLRRWVLRYIGEAGEVIVPRLPPKARTRAKR